MQALGHKLRNPVVSRRCLVSVRAAPVPAAKPAGKKEKKYAKDSLFLLNWQATANTGHVDALRDQLKVLEKVSKDAVWFTVKEGPNGMQQVLMVTNDAKKACKYGLTEVTEESAAVPLPWEGSEPVVIPVAQLKASIMMENDDSSDSDSSEDEMEGIRMKSMTKKKKDQPTNGRQATAAADADITAIEEDPHAKEHAAALVAGFLGGVPKEQEHIQDKAAAKMLKEEAKRAEKELKAARKAEEKAHRKEKEHAKEKEMKQQQPMAMMEDSSSSSGSESSEEEEAMGGMQGMKGSTQRKGASLGQVVAGLSQQQQQQQQGELASDGQTQPVPVVAAMQGKGMPEGESSCSSESSGSESEDEMGMVMKPQVMKPGDGKAC